MRSNRKLLIDQIDALPDSAIDKLLEFVSFQRYNFGLFDDDTDYLNSVPGISESIIKGMNTPVEECFETIE
jgi:hypothetical protein